jgi:ligand-binding sensor domain-containing protein
LKSPKSEIFRVALPAILILLTPAAPAAQKTGAWRDHFAYTQGADVLVQGGQAICVTSAGLLFFDGEAEKISKVNGLSDFGLTAALYDEQSGCIFVGYDNGSIDVLRSADPRKIRQGNQTKKIEAWKNFVTHGRKGINRFLRVDDLILVATNAQMLEIKNEEIRANYTIDEYNYTIDEYNDTLAVQDLALLGNTIAAATPKGLYTADKNSSGRYNSLGWQHRLTGSNVISLAVANGKLYALQADGTLQSTTDLQKFSQHPQNFSSPRALSVADGELWVATAAMLHNVDNTQNNISSYGGGLSSFSPRRVAAYQDGICIADAELGLVASSAGSFAQAAPNSPLKNQTVALDEYGGKIAAAASGALSILENKGTWTGSANSQIADAQAVKINPKNAAEIFVATSSGVATFSGASLLGKSGDDIRGMSFDADGNLFAFASNSATPVRRRNADGSWSVFSSDALQTETLGSVALANKVFWGIARPNNLYLYAPGANLADADDDKASVFSVKVSIDETFSAGNIYALAADRNGELWLGTDKGVVVYSAISDPFASVPQGQRIKIPTEIPGQAAYLLQYEHVTAIAVDGGNRKWLGTRDAGVFLQSDDGVEQLHAFNAQNSPLPSNNVKDIAVNGQTGEVIFATDKGMVGFYSDATAGRYNFDEVKVYPNPVRPDMSLVTIANLVEDASVKITDVSGNLVFFATANGGTITWNVQNLNGRRVATGVYLIFLADQTGQESKVVKMVVIN